MSDQDKELQFDQRRYPRAFVNLNLVRAFESTGAFAIWPNLERSEIVDISYGGVGLKRPGLFPFKSMDIFSLELHLGTAAKALFKVQVVWQSSELVGVQFIHISVNGYQALHQYLDAKLMGLSLKPVQAQYHKMAQFRYWYQGSGGTHLFFYLNPSGEIGAVDVQLQDEVVRFEAGKRPLENERTLKALLVLSQFNEAHLDLPAFLNSWSDRDK